MGAKVGGKKRVRLPHSTGPVYFPLCVELFRCRPGVMSRCIRSRDQVATRPQADALACKFGRAEPIGLSPPFGLQELPESEDLAGPDISSEVLAQGLVGR